jgi:hypothetical protein
MPVDPRFDSNKIHWICLWHFTKAHLKMRIDSNGEWGNDTDSIRENPEFNRNKMGWRGSFEPKNLYPGIQIREFTISNLLDERGSRQFRKI